MESNEVNVPEGAITAGDGGIQIQVKAVPGASRDRIVGWLGDHLKIAVTAPPEGGRANKAICRVLAGALGIRTSDVLVASGAAAARKRLLIKGLSVEDVTRRLRNC